MNSTVEYKKIIESFRNYDIVSRITSPAGQLFLRHDVDFDLGLALDMARIEHDMGIKSSYFIMLTSSYYNAMCAKPTETVKEMLFLDRDVLLHFDPSCYVDIKEGLRKEKELFSQIYSIEPDLISIHRPGLGEIDIGVRHANLREYSWGPKYFSDTNCLWKHGYPEPQKDMRTVQLATHPVWWMIKGKNEKEKCHNFIKFRSLKIDEDLKKSLKTYV